MKKQDFQDRYTFRSDSGQALVLVLLALSVVLTVVLFILSRSITDISVSSSESSAVSAFSAAEAGVENALVIGLPGSGAVGSANYTSQVTNVASGATSFIYPIEFNSGESATLWFKSQDAGADFTGSTVKICWGKAGTANNTAVTPALEAVVFYDNAANVKIFRVTADPYSSRSPANSFSAAGGSCTVSGQTFPFSITLNLTGLANPQFAFIRLFYNTDTPQPVAFDSTNASVFPSQGILVDSSGTAGQSSRRVEVFQGWPEIPSIFQFAVYSSTGITK